MRSGFSGRRFACAVGLASCLAGGALPAPEALAQQRFSMRVSWAAGSGCSGQSPPVTLSGVPRGTAKLAFSMVDLDLPSYNHGGGELAYAGRASFAAGELFGFFSSYRGPCPPPGETHRYEWTATALDAAGKPLATAKARLPFKR